jgi:hypothetical protein
VGTPSRSDRSSGTPESAAEVSERQRTELTTVMLAVADGRLGMYAPYPALLWLHAWLCSTSVGLGAIVLFAVAGSYGQLIALLLFVYAGLASAGGSVPVEALPGILRFAEEESFATGGSARRCAPLAFHGCSGTRHEHALVPVVPMDPETLTVRIAFDPCDLAASTSLAQLVGFDDQPVALVRVHKDLLLGEKNPRRGKDTTGGRRPGQSRRTKRGTLARGRKGALRPAHSISFNRSIDTRARTSIYALSCTPVPTARQHSSTPAELAGNCSPESCPNPRGWTVPGVGHRDRKQLARPAHTKVSAPPELGGRTRTLLLAVLAGGCQSEKQAGSSSYELTVPARRVRQSGSVPLDPGQLHLLPPVQQHARIWLEGRIREL